MATIVFDSEKEIEDFICSKLEKGKICPVSDESVDHWVRQFNLGAYGIADVIKMSCYPYGIDITIMEIKKEIINTDTLCQVARYMAGMRHFLEEKAPNFPDINIYGEVVAPNIDANSDCVFLLNQLENIGAYTIHYDLHDGFKCESHSAGWRNIKPSFANTTDAIFNELFNIYKKMMEEFSKQNNNIVDIQDTKNG